MIEHQARRPQAAIAYIDDVSRRYYATSPLSDPPSERQANIGYFSGMTEGARALPAR